MKKRGPLSLSKHAQANPSTSIGSNQLNWKWAPLSKLLLPLWASSWKINTTVNAEGCGMNTAIVFSGIKYLSGQRVRTMLKGILRTQLNVAINTKLYEPSGEKCQRTGKRGGTWPNCYMGQSSPFDTPFSLKRSCKVGVIIWCSPIALQRLGWKKVHTLLSMYENISSSASAAAATPVSTREKHFQTQPTSFIHWGEIRHSDGGELTYFLTYFRRLWEISGKILFSYPQPFKSHAT